MHSIERSVPGPENTLWCACAFQRGNFTGRGSEAVNSETKIKIDFSPLTCIPIGS